MPEITHDDRFAFGDNWRAFVESVDETRITDAAASLRSMLGVDSLAGQSFLDVGSGSGLFSLAALRMGAIVHSFDYDRVSVASTAELRRRFAPDAASWTVEQGSVLDREYLASLGTYDVVYSWGVLHHTGAMWEALANVVPLVARKGRLFIAIYNDQGRTSRRWHSVKHAYVRMPSFGQRAIELAVAALWGTRKVAKMVVGRRAPAAPVGSGAGRGMSRWHDLRDWVGGYPFEVATREAITDFYAARGFELRTARSVGNGHGCNEFVFQLT